VFVATGHNREIDVDGFYELPEPLGAAIHFVEQTNNARSNGIPIDSAQILASKVACVALREYFARVAKAVEEGKFDYYFGEWEDCFGEEEGKTEADGKGEVG